MDENILRFSTNLQCELIKKLALANRFDRLMDSMLEDIVDKANDVLKASSCCILIIDPNQEEKPHKTATIRAATGYNIPNITRIRYTIVPPDQVPEFPTPEEKLGISGWVISTGLAFLSSTTREVQNHPHHLGQGIPEKKQLAAYLAVPLRNPQGKIIGAFRAERLEGEPFSVYEQMLLETLGQLAGLCIAHVDMAKAGDTNTAITAWVLKVISEAVAEEGELDAFLDIIVRLISASTLADSCSVFLIDVNKRTLTQRAGCGHQVLRQVIRSYKLPESDQLNLLLDMNRTVPPEKKVGLTAWIASTGKSFYAKNFDELRKHPHHRGEYDQLNFPKEQQCGAFFAVPLRVGGTITGVLKIENICGKGVTDNCEFNSETRNRLITLAQSVALAIERLQFQAPSRYRIILDARPTIFDILKGNLSAEELVKKIVRDTANLFNARASALFLKEGNQLIQPPWAAYGWAQFGPIIRRYDLVDASLIKDDPTPEEKVGLTVWIAAKRKKFTAKSNLELRTHPHHKGTYDKHNFITGEQCETFMGVPLVVGDELIGVLKVETKMKNNEYAYFSEQDELVLELIANSAAIAIKNARLVESRLLADKIIAQPNNLDVIHVLYEFVEGRAEVINTLYNTAEIVRGRSRLKADIIDNLTGLFNPHFKPVILDGLEAMTEDPLKGLLGFIKAAVCVNNISEIMNLTQFPLKWGGILRPDFFLHRCAENIQDSWSRIHQNLNLYDADKTKRHNLQECMSIISEKEKSLVDISNIFEENLLKRIFQQWRKVIEIAVAQFQQIHNPYFAGIALPPNSNVFFGRKDIFDWVEDKLRYNRNCLLILHGSSRTGKTSILNQIQAGPLGEKLRTRTENPIFPVFIDLHQLVDTGTHVFLYTIADKISSNLQKQTIDIPEPRLSDYKEAPYKVFQSFIEFVTQKLERRNNGILTLMFDEFESLSDLIDSGKIEPQIFTYLRSIIQHIPSTRFILAGHHHIDELPPQYKGLIFTIADHKEVGFLDKLAAQELIQVPVKEYGVIYTDQAVEKMLSVTNGSPYHIQQLCSFCIDLLNDKQIDYTVTETLLEEAIKKALTKGIDSTLEQFWQSIGEDARHILKSLTQLTQKDNTPIHSDSMIAYFTDQGIDGATVQPILDKLIRQQIILEEKIIPDGPVQYRFAMDLMRRFILSMI